MEKIDIQKQFKVQTNEDLKRYEFNSVDNNSVSYTVGFHEASTIEDAYIAVYLAIQKDTKPQPSEQKPPEAKCPTCGKSVKSWGSSEPTFCSDSFHLSPEDVSKGAEDKVLHDCIQNSHILCLCNDGECKDSKQLERNYAEECLIRITGISRDSLRVNLVDHDRPNHLFNSEQVIFFMKEFAQQSMKQERERAIQECIEVLNEHHDTLPLAKSESDNGYSIAFANAVNILEKLKK